MRGVEERRGGRGVCGDVCVWKLVGVRGVA